MSEFNIKTQYKVAHEELIFSRQFSFIMSTKEKLQIAQKVQSIGQEWKRISKELNNQFSPFECKRIFESISMDKPIEDIVKYLGELYRHELLSKLGKIELEYSEIKKKKLKLDDISNSKMDSNKDANDNDTMDTSDIYSTETSRMEQESKRNFNNSSWQKTANMIWQKLADHRAGPLFLKPIKNDNYSKVIRQPMFLDTVKSRIRSKVFV
jgi:hypothetical protein